jgi:hypothetical protein
MVAADAGAYLESWADELTSRANRVRNLIGDAHWLSDGSHKEALLRDFIQRHLPRHLTVSNGFIKSSSDRESCSPEIDILIADASMHAPWFAESDLYITPPISVAAHIQVKTSYAKGELASALQNIYDSQTIVAAHARPEKVWRAVCFYTVPDSRTPVSVIDTLEATLRELAQSDWLASGAALEYTLPTCIVALSDWVIFFSIAEEKFVTLRFFELGKLSAACAMADLFAALRRWSGGDVTGDLDRLIGSLPIPTPIVRKINFGAQ